MKKIETKQKSSKRNSEERILNESMRLFLERGYHGTSIDDITEAAGLTKGALYWHFRSKEDLLRKIIEQFETHFLDGLIQAIKGARGNLIEKMEKYFRYTSAFAYYNPELCVSFTTLSAELIGAHHPIEPEIRRIYKKYKGFLSDLIRQGKKEKIFKDDIDPGLAALVIMAFHDGILLQWLMNKDKIDGRAYVNSSKKIILNGLMAG